MSTNTRKITFGDLVAVASISAIGLTIEWYDFFIAAIAATIVFPAIFFPSSVPEYIRLIYSYINVLLVGFIARPVGALIFGHFGDRIGRRWVTIIAMLLMAVAEVGMGLTPSYFEIGVAAIALVAIFRFLQGISVGTVWQGGATWITEMAYLAGSKRRAFWASWVNQGVPIGLALASAVLAALSAMYPGASFLAPSVSWAGWRIAFFIGGIIAVIGGLARISTEESLIMSILRATGRVVARPSISVWGKYWKLILLAMTIVIAELGNGYIFISYSPNFLTASGYERGAALLTQTIASVIAVFFIIGFSLLADRYGRRLMVLVPFAIGVFFMWAYPSMVFANYGGAVVAQVIYWAFTSMGAYAVMSSFIPELFSPEYRVSAAGYVYQIGGVLGGGLAPIFTALAVGANPVARWWGLSLVASLYFLVGALGAYFLPETKERKLE